MQQEINLGLRALKKPVDLDESLILKVCKTAKDAINLVVQQSGLKHEYIAESLGINKGHFSRMISRSGNRHFPIELIHQLEHICGNRAFTQFMALKYGDTLTARKLSRIELLEREIAELKGVA